MKTYLVFEPAEGRRTAESAGRVRFLREKFSWPALFFAPFWLLWHRLWLGFVLWLVALIALVFAVRTFPMHPYMAALVLMIPSIVTAFEAAELRRRKLIRRRFRETAVVVAHDLDEAERKFFAEWVKLADSDARRNPEPPPPPSAVPPAPMSGTVIGLFPEPGARR